MRLAIVTSEVNYVKDNYRHLLETICRDHRSSVVAIVVVRTINFSLFKKIFGLPLMGCPRLAWNLLRNVFRVQFFGFFNQFKNQGIQIHITKSVNLPETQNFLRSLQLDLILNTRTRNIFKSETLNIPKWGCINIHHGLLPHYRGTMCDLWALAEKRPIGFSVHWMNPKIDDGNLLKVHELSKVPTRSYGEVPYLSSLEEAKVLTNLLAEFKASGPKAGDQNQRTDKAHTRNPNFKQIRWIRQQGVRL